jgi:phenylalanyl-tRNA synthetase beta chain
MSGEYELDINREQVDFYHIKGVMEELLYFLGYDGRYSLLINDYIPAELHPGVSAAINVNGTNVGIIGKLHPNISKDNVYVIEINLTKLLAIRTGSMKFKELSKFPGMYKDVAFIVDNELTSKEIEQVIKKAGGKLLTNIQIFDLYPNVEEGKKSMAYKLYFQDPSRTLEDEEVMDVFNNIIKEVESKLNAKVRNS